MAPSVRVLDCNTLGSGIKPKVGEHFCRLDSYLQSFYQPGCVFEIKFIPWDLVAILMSAMIVIPREKRNHKEN